MKRIILVIVLLATAAYSQTQPSGAAVRASDGVWYLKASDCTWAGSASYPETLAVSSGKWTKPFKSGGGYINLEGVGILTAATDSFKIILYGSNSQNSSVSIDTTMLTKLDSCKVLTAGFYSNVFHVANKFKPYMVIEYVPLDAAHTITGKSRRNTLGMQ